jgi:hypothetical protein
VSWATRPVRNVQSAQSSGSWKLGKLTNYFRISHSETIASVAKRITSNVRLPFLPERDCFLLDSGSAIAPQDGEAGQECGSHSPRAAVRLL